MGCAATKERKYASLDSVKEPPPSYADYHRPPLTDIEETLAEKIKLYWRFVGVNDDKAAQISSRLRPYLNIGTCDPLSSAEVVRCMQDALEGGLSQHKVDKCADSGQPRVVYMCKK